MRLIPVIDVPPGEFAESAGAARRPLPEPPAATPADRDTWFLASLADAGIHELRPLCGWLVPAEQLVLPATIERVLTVHFSTMNMAIADAAEDSLEWLPLPGGFALQHGTEILIKPGCCGELGHVWEWQRAAIDLDESWHDLWIGHPWRSTRRAGSQIEISQPHENSPNGAQEPLVVEHRVAAADLQRAVDAARDELEALAERLRPIVAAHVAEPAPVLHRLVGLIERRQRPWPRELPEA